MSSFNEMDNFDSPVKNYKSLFIKWLSELYDEAAQRGLKTQYTYSKVRSLELLSFALLFESLLLVKVYSV